LALTKRAIVEQAFRKIAPAKRRKKPEGQTEVPLPLAGDEAAATKRKAKRPSPYALESDEPVGLF
jgi:hypothetical protein